MENAVIGLENATSRSATNTLLGYMHSPPKPAGVLPGERPQAVITPAVAVKSVYRDRRGPRPTVTTPVPATTRSTVP